jgi:Right handed beta helix region
LKKREEIMNRAFSLAVLFMLQTIMGVSWADTDVTFLDETFERGHGSPNRTQVHFVANGGIGRLIIASGHDGTIASTVASSAMIGLNGSLVVGPSAFNQRTRVIEKDVRLVDGANVLEVEMLGKPGAIIAVSVVQSFSDSIAANSVWSGDAYVKGPVTVLPGAVLTILPGTRVKMSHYRGYREPEKRIHFIVKGGIIAEGTPEAPIYFTSDAEEPQNGDWSMMRLLSPTGPAVFRYCVFEFAQQGLNVWAGDIEVTNSVFRWNNWEGIYFESTSTAAMSFCQLVENGYNGLAAEQFNTIDMEKCEVWRNGTSGIHVDASVLEIRESLVHDNGAHGLSVDDNGVLKTYGVDSYDNQAFGLGQGQGANDVWISNFSSWGNGSGNIQGAYSTVSTGYFAPAEVDIGFEPDMSYALGYIPSDQLLDKYLYVYPDDETRRIVRKIGEGLGLTWSVAWDGSSIWTATVNGKIYKLDPFTGAVLNQFYAPGSQPWGMTWDGQYLWVVDFAEKRISKIDPTTGSELATYPTPDPVGGCKGVAWDGTYLNVMGWTSPKIYQIDTNGNLVSAIDVQMQGNAGGIAWDGTHFWIPAGKLLRVDIQGNVVGWIYPASEGTWDMTWDGQYLWATQRTNENWDDAKLFALEILEIQLPQP